MVKDMIDLNFIKNVFTTYPWQLTILLKSPLNLSTPHRSSRPNPGWLLNRCHASTGVISPSRLILALKCNNSLITLPLAVHGHVSFGFGGWLEYEMRGVEAIST